MTAEMVLAHVRSLGWAVSVHRMENYVELHGVWLADPDIVPFKLVRVCGGDGEEEVYQAACALARAVGVDLEDG